MVKKGKYQFDVCILGLAPQGLALLRAYSEAGYSCIAIGLRNDVGIFSRYGKIYIIEKLSQVIKIMEDHLSGAETIHISGDVLLNYLIDNYPNIFNVYNIYPKFSNAIIFRDKLKTLKLANDLDIPYPKTWKFNLMDSFMNNKLPFIIKWNRTFKYQSFKTIIINQIKDVPTSIYNENYEDLILQEYVKGESVSYAGFWNEGIEIVGIIVHQKRQFPIGLTSFATEIHGYLASHIKTLSETILSKTKFSGFCEVEYKIDSINNKVYLLEVNPRACGWIKILINNFKLYLLKKDFLNHSCKQEQLCWTNLARDFNAIMSLLRTSPNQLKIRDLIIDYLNNPIMDIFDLYDIKPFLFQFSKAFKGKKGYEKKNKKGYFCT